MTDVQRPDTAGPTGTPPRHEPVFLLSPARSYSTVTLALLAGHPDIYGFPEMLLFASSTVGQLLDWKPKPWQPPEFVEPQRNGILRAVADLREASQEDAAILRAEKWLEERSAWSTRQLMDHLLAQVYPQIGLEKSPETIGTDETLDACVNSYPQARYIHLTRNPVGSIRSMLDQMHHWSDSSEKAMVVRAASSWYLGHMRIVSKLAELPSWQWTRIRAEDLLREPESRLPPLLNWLGLRANSDVISRMRHTENWRFAHCGPSKNLGGGDPKFLRSPALRPIPEPGEIAFDESWGLLEQMRDRMTILAKYLGY